ncbi:MAG: Ig-like domain-containing protein [Candidatus Diapherotrites archaeon]
MPEKRMAMAIFIALLLGAPLAFSAHTSQNYSITNIVIEPSDEGASENYRIYDAGEEPIGSGEGTSVGYSLWIGFPATVGIPRVPGALSTAVDSNTQITVSWDANGNQSGVTYQLQETSPVSQSLYSGANTQYVHSSLSAGQQYCYKIRAYAGVYSVYSAEKCASTMPSEPVVSSSHTQNAWDTNSVLQFTATSSAHHFYYAWNQAAGTAVSAGDTQWDGNAIVKTATSDGNWYFHVRSANADNNLNDGGTVHYGPYNIDSNVPYTYDDANSYWQTTNVHVILGRTDNASGITNTYYCMGSDNSCTPSTTGTTADVTCNTTCQTYLRYYSVDLAGNQESVRSRLIKIDKENPSTPTVTDEGSISSDFSLTFTYTTLDNNGSGISDFYLELHSGSTSGPLVYGGWTGDNDGSYAYLGALEAHTYYAKGKVKDALNHESSFSAWTDAVYVNATSHPSSANYALDMYTVVPSGSTDSDNYSIADLVIGQAAVSMSSDNYTAETGFGGGFIENSAPTITYNSPNSGYYGSGTISIDFNVKEAENDRPYLTIAYSTTKGAFQVTLLDDVNLNDYADISNLDCDSNAWSSSVNCVYSWDASSVQDGNYYVDFNAHDTAGAAHSTSSSASIKIDKTAPVTSSDYNGDWSGADLNITLSCNDGSGSGCSLTQYRLDSNPSSTVSFGSWLPYSEKFAVSGDGNWVIDFNSVDLLGNAETTNRQYILINKAFSSMELQIPAGFEIEIKEDLNKTLWYKCTDYAGNVETAQYIYICLDKNPPTTTDDINSDWRSADAIVTLTAADPGSGVQATYHCTDDSNSCNPLSGTIGATFSVSCDADSVCQKYVRYLSVDNAGSSEAAHGELVRIDNQKPGTSAVFTDGWLGDTNVAFSCSDGSGSGCKKLKYRVDSGGWQEATISGNDVNVLFSTDGNHLVEYYSLDNVDNNEAIKQGWLAIDKNPPSVTITDPSTDDMEKGTPTISFNIGRLGGSSLDLSSIVVDFNGTASDDFNALAHCTVNNGDYNCSYTELNFPETDYNLSVYAKDAANNARKASRVFTLKAIIAVRYITPSGGFVKGVSSIHFEVKNTMLNDVYAKLFISGWFGRFDSNISPVMHLDQYSEIQGLSCASTNWWDWTACTYSWNSAGVSDGNYFIDLNFYNASGGNTAGHSLMPFLVDNTPPVANVGGVSSTPVYFNRVYLGCSDAGSGCMQTKWYYFSSSQTCSSSKSSYDTNTNAGYIEISTEHSDYICLWVEDKAGFNARAVSAQLQIEPGVYVISSISSESMSIATQDLNNECRMYLDQNITIECAFKSTIKISEYENDLNRVWQESPELVVSPPKTIRVLVQSEIESFYNKDYFLKFESEQRTITSLGNENDYQTVVVRRRVMPLLTTEGQLEVGTLTILIRQK